ncbi:C-X-C motif chemokine 9-like [Carassius auratus]|uniref:C-X-C motif chemokine 9-like n=1 Tax=Carassius auratus TaxID=7957 RepID=A0A6P6N337_CARAU|nr:C-X-C motif chemokine 9-like [Carassius auratus]XP_026103402.1 C-X-C motif chemokine 9-like [Carassius auratus]XP_052428178.1 C-X-C motif chemokine 9-like [Carassius gibelio]
MAFRTLQASACMLLLISVCLHFMTGVRTSTSREKCECVEETGSVQWRKIIDYTIIQKHPLCNKVQIILQLSGQQACLNPDSMQGKRLQKCWKRIQFNTQKGKDCLMLLGPKKPKQL